MSKERKMSSRSSGVVRTLLCDKMVVRLMSGVVAALWAVFWASSWRALSRFLLLVILARYSADDVSLKIFVGSRVVPAVLNGLLVRRIENALPTRLLFE